MDKALLPLFASKRIRRSVLIFNLPEQDSQHLKKSQPPERIRRAATMLPPSLTVSDCRRELEGGHGDSTSYQFCNGVFEQFCKV
ncbi:hypothetical protein SLEP1_g2881 [Rubroshorea leprosula]|uniref:Uncharacterized protein n=1 Tax=Rubroshorea leprosula TaxID=152421 RepID=A0AAV5HTZ0_9ROSI|nr:hypothetical protein SLEP1_g2881 [Rubroshorea leprosula]